MNRAHILSVSYDKSLLKTREMILNSKGYRVTSALGLDAALAKCRTQFDAFVLGHSIPRLEKESLIEAFRANSSGPVIALKRQGEGAVRGADVEIAPEPEQLITTLAQALTGSL